MIDKQIFSRKFAVLLHTLINTLVGALAIGLCARAHAMEPASGTQLYVNSNNDLIVEYTKPREGLDLLFVDGQANTHAVVRSQFWKSADECGVIEQTRVVFKPACTKAKFAITWDAVARDRIYPAVVTLKNGGRLVFLRNIHTVVDRAISDLVIAAPKAGIARFNETATSTQLSLPAALTAQNKDGWAYLGPDTFIKQPDFELLIDTGVPAYASDIINSDAAAFLAFYAKQLNAKPKQKTTFYLHWDNRDRPDGRIQADVASGGVIRFGLSGSNWLTSNVQNNQNLQATLAHELAHIWNSKIFQAQAPWLKEGNAELLSVAALLSLKHIDEAAASERLSQAFHGCLAAAKGVPWSWIAHWRDGKVPYDCGLVIQFAIVANANANKSKLTTMSFWRNHWRVHTGYSEATLRQFFASIVTPIGVEQLNALFESADAPLAKTLPALLQNAGLTLTEQPVIALNSDIFTYFMRLDCEGAHGYYINADHFLTDQVPSCKTIRVG